MTIVPSSALNVKSLTNTGPADRPLGDLMREAHRTLVGYLERALRGAGYDDVGAAHASVLATVDPAGVRLATLVDRGGRTKQATSELAAHLVGRGYLQVRPDATDGRAKLYLPTPEGTALLIACGAVVIEYETWLDEALGRQGVEKLRRALVAIVGHGQHAVTASDQMD